MSKKILVLFFLFATLLSSAQEAMETGPEMADKFRSDGKIYVVISVIAIIFVCIVAFLITLERKLKKLESRMKSKAGE